MRIKAVSIKCIHLSAAAGRRYKQKVHTLYMPIYLHRKVYTLYIRIEPQIPGKYCIKKYIKGFLPAEHPAKRQEHQVHQVIYIRQGNFKNPVIQQQRCCTIQFQQTKIQSNDILYREFVISTNSEQK